MTSTMQHHDSTATRTVPGGRTADARRTDHPNSPGAPATRPRRRARRLGVIAGAVAIAFFASSCHAGIPLDQWVPDFNGDGTIDGAEVTRQEQAIAMAVINGIEQQRRSVQNHPFLTCVRHHESDRTGGYPYTGGYGAQNPYSSASGAYQFIDSTWRTAAARYGHGGYARAKYAPWWVQDAVALAVYRNGGRSAWAGTGC